MSIDAWIEQSRPYWFNRVTSSLSSKKDIQESLNEPICLFFDALLQAVASGDAAFVEPILTDWIETRPQSNVDDENNTLAPILTAFLSSHLETAREYLPPEDALNLFQAILPIYTHAYDFTYRIETRLKIEQVIAELEQANEYVKRVDQSKADFISVAAHELKTPLTLIEGYRSMLTELLADNAINSQAEIYLKGIQSGYKRLREIVEDLISVSLIDNNILPIHYQPVWLCSLLDIVVQEVSGIVAERKILLEISRFPGSEERIFGDGEQLVQAFRKLIANAIKYTPDGGAIKVDGRKLPGFIEITVEDTGIGIDPADHLYIFEKFGRLGSPSLYSSSKTHFKGGGPGLGLSITKGIVEAHGGAIWVESEGYDETKYKGSTFHVLLPLRKEPPDDKTAQIFKQLGQ
jgi:signal transduction histidine kinase